MNDGAVSHCYVFPDNGGAAVFAVDNGVALDVGSRPHYDGRNIAAQHATKPDAGPIVDDHVADEDSRGATKQFSPIMGLWPS